MSAPRLRRLAADYEAVRAEFSGHPHVHVAPLGPQRPPEAYRVTFRVRGLRLEGNQPIAVESHEVELRLPMGYPREKPLCTPLTPVFHPNIKEYYCLQDYWAAGQALADTIAKIADMIQYRVYNTASPLDALAARWASQNSSLFPLGNVTLGTPEVAVTLGSAPRAAPAPSSDSAPADAALPVVDGESAGPEADDADLLITLRGSG
jgi:ubiquitin-protein ligase